MLCMFGLATHGLSRQFVHKCGGIVDYSRPVKTRRNIYMGQEYLDLEAIVVHERKRTGRDLSVADLVRKACKEYVEAYWKREARDGSVPNAQ